MTYKGSAEEKSTKLTQGRSIKMNQATVFLLQLHLKGSFRNKENTINFHEIGTQIVPKYNKKPQTLYKDYRIARCNCLMKEDFENKHLSFEKHTF